jgi:hypothetical protein
MYEGTAALGRLVQSSLTVNPAVCIDKYYLLYIFLYHLYQGFIIMGYHFFGTHQLDEVFPTQG